MTSMIGSSLSGFLTGKPGATVSVGGILQNINTKLAQQDMNVQVPVPKADVVSGSSFGGMLKRWGLGEVAPTPPPPAPASVPGSSSSAAMPATQSPSAAPQASTSSASSTALTGPDAPRMSESASMMSTASTSSFSATRDQVPLKKVQFTVSSMCVTYPISNVHTPGSEDVTRRRIEKEHRQRISERKHKVWTLRELEQLYRECCRTREELPLKKMRIIFTEAAQANAEAKANGAGGAQGSPLKVLDLSYLPLDRGAIDPLADFLSVDFGLAKLVLENCGLTDDVSGRARC